MGKLARLPFVSVSAAWVEECVSYRLQKTAFSSRSENMFDNIYFFSKNMFESQIVRGDVGELRYIHCFGCYFCTCV